MYNIQHCYTPRRIAANINEMNNAMQALPPPARIPQSSARRRSLSHFLSWEPEEDTRAPDASDHSKPAGSGAFGQGCFPAQHAPQRDEVGGWRETMVYFRYLWRCGIHFAVARYGDGELSIMSGRSYASETDIGNWSISVDAKSAGYAKLMHLLTDGFRLAAEHSKAELEGGMYAGLPFNFCAEGVGNFRRGGGGHDDWLMEYLTRFAPLLSGVDPRRLVYSWQWGNHNYPHAMEFVTEMAASMGELILVCNEAVAQHPAHLPLWAFTVLLVPGDGVRWMASQVDEVAQQARRLARAHHNKVFLFSAGPISNALIPLMWRANPNNTYLDFGGTLDYVLHGIQTRPFLPDASGTSNWVRADGLLERDQACHQTRYGVFWEQTQPRVVALDV